MAKGKKSSGKTYTSKGEHSNVSKELKKAVRRDYMNSGERLNNQIAAENEGRRVVYTIPNPNPNETNKRFIKRVVEGKNVKRG